MRTRDDEPPRPPAWDALEHAWQHASTGASRFAEVAGDPGLGKSHLLGLLAEHVRSHGGTAVLASARSVPRGPYALLQDACECLGEDLGLDECDPHDPHAVGRLMRDRLGQRAGGGPLLVVLDDAHAADEASLRALCFLTRHRPSGPLLVCVSYRPRQAPALLASVLAGLDREDTRLSLAPACDATAARLLRADADDVRVRPVNRFCEGNPLYLAALAKGRGLDLVPPGGDWRQPLLPPGVAAELTRDLAELGATAQLVARAAAVAGERFNLGLVTAICGIDGERVLLGLDELVSADVVRHSERNYAFRHPLTWKATLETTGHAWRITAHRRALDALKARGAPAQEYAGHLEWAAGEDGPSLSREFAAAGRAVLPVRPALAAHWLDLAVQHAPGQGPGLLLDRAAATLDAGHLRRAYRLSLEASDTSLEAGSPDRVRALRMAAYAGRLLGRTAEAGALLFEALDVAEEPGDRAETALWLAITQLSDVEPGLDLCRLRQQLGHLAAHGCRVTRALCSAVHAVCEALMGEGGTSNDLRTAIRLVDQTPDAELAGRLDLVAWLCWAELRLERHADALRHSRRAAALARAAGRAVPLGLLLTVAGSAAGYLSRPAESAAALDEAVAVLAGEDHAYLRAHALIERSATARRGGDLPAAARWAGRALAATPDRLAAAHLSAARLGAGEAPERDAGEFLRHAGGPRLSALPALYRADFYLAVITAGRVLGLTDQLAHWGELLEKEADATGLAGRIGLSMVASATALLAAGQPAKAAARAAAAADLMDREGASGSAAHVRALAESVRGQAEERSRTPDGTTMDLLTCRELEIAELVSSGVTNGQVARRLGVSEKTVEGHLSRVYRKLDIPSRAALATLFTRSHFGDPAIDQGNSLTRQDEGIPRLLPG
ncbi:AAA family ATPase [Nonomuraea sp. B10E15]|uniref:LuxR C-terminal-related transcriptional regulator n=1 Tax=Nonomuraea sp. B10E15 TaxID=3153560 RepID=UPI00325D1735